jgi:hypothetical protein
MYLASKVPESSRYIIYIEEELRKAENDVKFVTDINDNREIRNVQRIVNKTIFRQFWQDFRRYFATRQNLKILIILLYVDM